MRYVGIDPGVSGAIAHLREGGTGGLVDLPVMVIEGKKRRTVLHLQMALKYLKNIIHWSAEPVTFLLEAPVVGPAMRRSKPGDPPSLDDDGKSGQSIVTLANSFRLNGQIEGMLVALGVAYEIVQPQVWKRAMMPGEARDKDAARLKAIQLFPAAAEELKLKKHHNRAEALLLAEYGRRRG